MVGSRLILHKEAIASHESESLFVSGIPPAETFSFVFNTLLNDIATHNLAWADRIIDAQVGKSRVPDPEAPDTYLPINLFWPK